MINLTEPVIDDRVYDEIAQLMEDSMGVFIETYLDNSPKLLIALNEGLPAGDVDKVIHSAHQLKGGSGSIGAMKLFQLAKRIEDEAREDALDQLTGLLEQINAAYAEVETELRSRM